MDQIKSFHVNDDIYQNDIIIENGVKYTVTNNGVGFLFWKKYQTRILHREGDLPAVHGAAGFSDADKYWYWEGQLHRILGPAVIWCNGTMEWWYHGENVPVKTQVEYEQWLRLKAFA